MKKVIALTTVMLAVLSACSSPAGSGSVESVFFSAGSKEQCETTCKDNGLTWGAYDVSGASDKNCVCSKRK